MIHLNKSGIRYVSLIESDWNEIWMLHYFININTFPAGTILTDWDSHQKVWWLNIHCDNSLVIDIAE